MSATAHPPSDPVLDVIGRIYDAALDPSRWLPVMGEIVRLLGGSRGVILSPRHGPEQGGLFIPYGLSESHFQQYAAKYREHDLWLQAAVAKGYMAEGSVVTDADLVPHRELLDSVYYREFLSTQDIARVASAVVFGMDSRNSLPTILSVYRSVAQPAFDEREVELLRILGRHLSRAIGVMSRIGTAGWRLTAVHAALDRLQQGVVLFGEARAVLHVNHAARSVLAEDDGLRLAVQPDAQHMLAVADPVLQDVLDGAIDRCLDREARAVPHFSAGVRIERPSGRAPMVLNFAALSESNEYIGGVLPRAIAFIGDGEASATVDASLLQRLFGLTGAEAQLALTLFRGETLAQAAATLTVSDNTAKSQLGRIFDKTGTQRQAQLMRLLAGLAAC